MAKSLLKLSWPALFLLFLSGCASYGVVVNEPLGAGQVARDSYSIRAHLKRSAKLNNDIEVVLAFSGGGTRAAAFSYGILKALRDTTVMVDGRKERLLDEVDFISSVSGGSFTAAYYGLHGDRVFEDFEDRFLRRDVQGGLVRGLFNPLRTVSNKGRTEVAIGQYEADVFEGATFADMAKENRPLIVINASDLAHGVRFSFIQDYFDLLCSDLSTFPVSRAVAASSAVPVLFTPVVVRNHTDCMADKPGWFTEARKRSADNPEIALALDGVETYFDKEHKKYAHFVDGGITDNLGLRAFYEIVEFSGGVASYIERANQQLPRRMVLIVVNASRERDYEMVATSKTPSLAKSVGALSDAQLHHYSAATLALMRRSMIQWAEELSTPEQPVVPYVIELGFRDIIQPKKRRFFNQIPTSFSLTDEQVDELIVAGRDILQANSEFRRLLDDLGKDH